MKKIRLLSLILLLLIVCSSSAFAVDGAYGYNYSTDSTKNQAIYYKDTWSVYRNWNYTDVAIPDNAVVRGVMMKFTTTPTSGYSGLNYYLYNEAGAGYKITYADTIYHNFDGQPLKQIWKGRFYVTQWNSPGNPLFLTPQLVIYYRY